MPRAKTNKHDEGLVTVAVRLAPTDLAEVKKRAEVDRRPWSQFLRLLIHDALGAKRIVR